MPISLTRSLLVILIPGGLIVTPWTYFLFENMNQGVNQGVRSLDFLNQGVRSLDFLLCHFASVLTH